jgi:hypothetical protein
MTKLVKFARVKLESLVLDVSVGKEELGRALDPSERLAHSVHLTFPTLAEFLDDAVLPKQDLPFVEVE